MISIITPTYNRANLLMRAYRSLGKNDGILEWIVIDDGSTDETEELIQEWIKYDDRIKYFKLPVNRGVNAARMAGVRLSKGEAIYFMDSDDELRIGAIDTLNKARVRLCDGVGAIVFPIFSNGDDTSLNFRFQDGHIIREIDAVCFKALDRDFSYLYDRKVFEFQSLPEDLRGCESLFVFGIMRKFSFLTENTSIAKINRQDDNLSGSLNVIKRSGDIGKSYVRMLDQHKHLWNDFPEARMLYFVKALIRLRIANYSTKDLRRYLPRKPNKIHVIWLIIHLLPSSLIRYLDILRIKRENKKEFGKD